METMDAAWESLTQPEIDSRALTPPTPAAERVANLLVIATVAIALLLGLVLKTAVQGRTSAYEDGTISLDFPATWVVDQDASGNAMVRNPQSSSTLFNARVLVFHDQVPDSGLPGSSPLAEAATAWTLQRSRGLNMFRNLATQDGLTVAGRPAIRIDYAHVTDPAADLGRPGIPVVVRGSDILLIQGDRLTVISGQASAIDWQAFQQDLDAVLESAALTQGGAP
jgi:hypothetical protein